jgi:Skp family chaperone for outer membrane proteins
MGEKDNLLWEIRILLEKLIKDRGLYIIENEGKFEFEIDIYYTNVKKQKELVYELLRKNNIDKRYYRFFDNLLDQIFKIEIFSDYVSKKVDELKKLRDKLKEIYENFREDDYLKKLEDRINKEFKYDLDHLNNYLKEERLYIKFLNGKIDYNEDIKDFEDDLIFSKELKYKSWIYRKIKRYIKKLLNSRKFKIIWIKRGFVLVMLYKDKDYDNYNKEWVYLNNAFYLIDLRNKRMFDVSKKISKILKSVYIDEFREDNIYTVYDKVDVSDLLI